MCQPTHKPNETVMIYTGNLQEGEARLEEYLGTTGKLEKWSVRFKDSTSNRTFTRYIKTK